MADDERQTKDDLRTEAAWRCVKKQEQFWRVAACGCAVGACEGLALRKCKLMKLRQHYEDLAPIFACEHIYDFLGGVARCTKCGVLKPDVAPD